MAWSFRAKAAAQSVEQTIRDALGEPAQSSHIARPQ